MSNIKDNYNNGNHSNGTNGSSNTFTSSSNMVAFEIEDNDNEEIDSLINETIDNNNTIQNSNSSNNNNKSIVRGLQTAYHRKGTNTTTNKLEDTSSSTIIIMNIRGLVRSSIGLASTYRNFVVLACIALICIMLVFIETSTLQNDATTYGGEYYNKIIIPQYHPHEASFGGVQNSAQYNNNNKITTSTTKKNSNIPMDLSYEEYLHLQGSGTSQSRVSSRPCDSTTNTIDTSTSTSTSRTQEQQQQQDQDDYNTITFSNIGQRVVSTNTYNYISEMGHYLHDPIHSPYSSKLYKSNSISKLDRSNDNNNNTNTTVSSESESQLQVSVIDSKYIQKQQLLMKEYGYWNVPVWPNSTIQKFTIPNDNILYKNFDVPIEKFSSLSWHLQSDYVGRFLQEAKDLVQRIQHGIYTEYGIVSNGVDNELDAIQLRQQSFNILKVDYFNNHDVQVDTSLSGQGRIIDVKSRQPIPCGSYMTTDAYNILVRKLLHAIITEGTFIVITVSAGDYTYQGNNMFHSTIMQFQYLLQPIFDKLGIKLISRNMGMDTHTTSVNSLGGSDIYGESDILWYIPDHRDNDNDNSNSNNEQTSDHFDLLHIQSILSGERVPIILTSNYGTIPKELQEQNKEIWMGNIQPGYDTICSRDPETTIDACQYIFCNEPNNDDNPSCTLDQYNSVCWVERSDYTPKTFKQNTTIGRTNEHYKNPRQHLLDSRKLAMLVLQALEEAITIWETEYSTHHTVLLPNDIWHVSNAYDTMKESVRDIMTSGCETLLKDISIKICHIQMHAYTEWTPRVTNHGVHVSYNHSALADETNVYKELYDNVDLLPIQWQLPDTHIDVHMLGILTNTTHLQKHIIEQPPSTTSTGSKKNPNHLLGEPSTYDDDYLLTSFDEQYTTDDIYNGDDTYYLNPPRRKTNRWLRQQHNRNLISSTSTSSSIQNEFNTSQHSTHNINIERRVESTLRLAKDRWTVYKRPIGHCDGSSESRCNRSFRNPCLLANYNHYKAGLMGHSNSGPIQFEIDGIKEGIVLARFDWDDSNNIKPMLQLPDDFIFQYTIYSRDTNDGIRSIGRNVLVSNNVTKSQFISMGKVLASDLIIHPLWIDTSTAQVQHEIQCQSIMIEIEIKSSSSKEKEVALLLTHIYYA